MVGCGEGVVYLDVQLILAYSWARPAVLVAGEGIGEMFLFLLFLHFHSCSFFPVPLFHLLYDLFISCDDRIGKMLHNICISAVAMSLR